MEARFSGHGLEEKLILKDTKENMGYCFLFLVHKSAQNSGKSWFSGQELWPIFPLTRAFTVLNNRIRVLCRTSAKERQHCVDWPNNLGLLRLEHFLRYMRCSIYHFWWSRFCGFWALAFLKSQGLNRIFLRPNQNFWMSEPCD